MLFIMWRFEHESPKKRKNYEDYCKSNRPEDLEKFLEYEEKIIKKTPDIKQMYFDFIDDKSDFPNFEYFMIK